MVEYHPNSKWYLWSLYLVTASKIKEKFTGVYINKSDDTILGKNTYSLKYNKKNKTILVRTVGENIVMFICSPECTQLICKTNSTNYF